MELRQVRLLRFWGMVLCVMGVGLCVLSKQYTAAMWALVAAITNFQRWMDTPQ